MGNNRFRLSDMIPNAWFHKLKEIGRARNPNGTIINNNKNTRSSIKRKEHIDNASTTTSVSTSNTIHQLDEPNQPLQHHSSYHRNSYIINRDLNPFESRFHSFPTLPEVSDTHLPDPPRKSSKQKPRRRPNRNSPKLVSSSVSTGCSYRTAKWSKLDSPLESSPSLLSDITSDEREPQFSSLPPAPEFRSDHVLATNKNKTSDDSWSASFGCEEHSNSNPKDIVIDVGDKFSVAKFNNLGGFDQISSLDLPPIISKPSKITEATTKCRRSSACIAVNEKKKTSSVIRRLSTTSPGVRLRINSPRLMNSKFQGRKSVSSSSRRSISDSLAVVKSSFDPQKDFRDSMVEMIMENNIRASKDLEELLACYLSLNSDEYHDLIIKVFKQIWLDLTDIRVK